MNERHVRIVVIDDDIEILMFANMLLTAHLPAIARIHISTHINWEYAAPNWDEVAVVIVDLKMPIPGKDILEYIKEKYSNVARIAWTGFHDESTDIVEKEGLAIVIQKPGHAELVAHVSGILNL